MRHGKKQQSRFIILFLCIMVSINNADLRVRSFLAAAGAPQDPCPRGPASREGPALLPVQSEQRLIPRIDACGRVYS